MLGNVVLRPHVEGKLHGVAVHLSEERIDVLREAHCFARRGQCDGGRVLDFGRERRDPGSRIAASSRKPSTVRGISFTTIVVTRFFKARQPFSRRCSSSFRVNKAG